MGFAVLLAGCSGIEWDSGPEGSPEDESLVQDQSITLDLRTRPSRRTLGLLPGQTAAGYAPEDDDRGLTTRVLLPDGEIQVQSYSVLSHSSNYGPEGILPDKTTVRTEFPSTEDARAVVLAQARALGVDPVDIEVGIAQDERVIGGFSNDWLSIEVIPQGIGDDGRRRYLTYQFNYYDVPPGGCPSDHSEDNCAVRLHLGEEGP